MTQPGKKRLQQAKPKTEFLQIRLSVEDRRRVNRAATAEYLDASTWARQAIMKALYESENKDRAVRQRVAEGEPPPNDRPPRSRDKS